MLTLLWIVLGGLLMCAVALIGGVSLLVSSRSVDRLMLPMVAMAAGSLIGGALFHLMPGAVAEMGNRTATWVWAAVGFVSFFVLEQFLHWHHCHRSSHDHHAPQTWLLLFADSLHNFLGGLSVGGAFVLDTHLGAIALVAAMAHEVPQELGDFGVLVQGGWEPGQALIVNVISASTFLVGGVLAWAISARLDVAFLLALGAGNFLYIAASDLIPEIKQPPKGRSAILHFTAFLFGLVLLLAVRLLFAPDASPAGP